MDLVVLYKDWLAHIVVQDLHGNVRKFRSLDRWQDLPRLLEGGLGLRLFDLLLFGDALVVAVVGFGLHAGLLCAVGRRLGNTIDSGWSERWVVAKVSEDGGGCCAEMPTRAKMAVTQSRPAIAPAICYADAEPSPQKLLQLSSPFLFLHEQRKLSHSLKAFSI